MPDNRDPDVLLSDATVAEEDREAQDGADAGPPPTAEEEAAADRGKASAAGVDKPYRDMTERGANVKGAGQIE